MIDESRNILYINSKLTGQTARTDETNKRVNNMSNAFQRTLAVTLAAAVTGFATLDADAQSNYRQQADQAKAEKAERTRQNMQRCRDLGKEEGVQAFPLTGKAVQTSDDLGCAYNTASGKFFVTNAYDLNDPADAQKLNTEVERLGRVEATEQRRLGQQNPQRDAQGNILQEAAKTVRDANQVGNAVRNTQNILKGIGIGR